MGQEYILRDFSPNLRTCVVLLLCSRQHALGMGHERDNINMPERWARDGSIPHDETISTHI